LPCPAADANGGWPEAGITAKTPFSSSLREETVNSSVLPSRASE
jgi:hypothetical protein